MPVINNILYLKYVYIQECSHIPRTNKILNKVETFVGLVIILFCDIVMTPTDNEIVIDWVLRISIQIDNT